MPLETGNFQELSKSEADPQWMVIPRGYSLVCRMCVISKIPPMRHVLVQRLQPHAVLSKHHCRIQYVLKLK